jgi:hypothetical protein
MFLAALKENPLPILRYANAAPTSGNSVIDPKIIFATHSAPLSTGNGGNHRSYQIVHELADSLGLNNGLVNVLVRPNQSAKLIQNQARQAPNVPTRWKALKHRVKVWLKHLTSVKENPFYLTATNNFSIDNYLSLDYIQAYTRVVQTIRPRISIVDHVGFAPLVHINREYHILTLACPQNMEALDAPLIDSSRWNLRAMAYNWSHELMILRQCEARLCISKVETALLNGLGIGAQYYAYQPVGEIRAFLNRIRQKRAVTQPERGLFLMPGSGFHASTREGMLWLFRQVVENHLPNEIRIVVFGAQTHTLPSTTGITTMGWIDEAQLEHYMTIAEGVLLPQFQGFGSSTKLYEFSAAHIPIIATEHLVSAVDPMPHLWLANQRWESWIQAMHQVMNRSESRIYPERETPTESPLINLIRDWLQ